MENFIEIRNLLIKYAITEYANKVISNIIEQNKDIFTDEFIKELNANSKLSKNLINIPEQMNTETRLYIRK